MQRLRRDAAPRVDAGHAPQLAEDVFRVLTVPVERDDGAGGRGGRVLDEDATVNQRRNVKNRHFTGAGTVSVTSLFFSAWLTVIARARNAFASVIAFGIETLSSVYDFVSVSLGTS